MQFTTLLTTLFATLTLTTALPAPEAIVLTSCGIINSTVSSGENAGRRTTTLVTGGCKAVEGITYYYRVDSGCTCSFYTVAGCTSSAILTAKGPAQDGIAPNVKGFACTSP
ncbi:hypothetical protein K458DRAFT_490183 [Lentithecium fluviatile CBS 122367]|uniref:Uncharacterized protein n=1 Tax=Lentithecium fluviatile CBS 122367 TaxID=1168545 RepID=A0A6G1IP51_9PLEO|nr:hypothetical protein K458DRAFT_490183 [Lentithecium fluviatile CBS 122367]